MFRKPVCAVLIALLGWGLGSCSGSGGTIVAPPGIPGASYVGADTCAACHADIAAEFSSATHAVLNASGDNAVAGGAGCESCHGPGSLHFESGGDPTKIINPANGPGTCFQCHLDVRAQFALPNVHPATGGPLGLTTAKIGCPSCHELHTGSARPGGGTQILALNEKCLSCHPAQRGPYVFEHEALRDGCTVCHQPHGSVNAALLTERNATLCLKCHYQDQPTPGTILIGGRDHSFFLARGTCYSAGCHEAVHGSQVNSSLRF